MLIDEVKKRGIRLDSDALAEFANGIVQDIDRFQVVHSTNVFNYIKDMSATGKAYSDIFPQSTHPFPLSFVEWRQTQDNVTWQMGCFVLTHIDNVTHKSVGCFLEFRDGYSSPGLIGLVKWENGPQGHFNDKIEAIPALRAAHPMYSECVESLQGFLCVPLMTFSFMSCKNVRRVENAPDEKLQKARARKGKPPLSKYYTLEIEPMKEILRKEGGIEENGLKRALHICRGHFSTYTEDKPLFGKKAGTFWIPAHTRGSSEQGTIKKDYSIKLPKQT